MLDLEKARIAADFIVKSCPTAGGSSQDGRVLGFVADLAREMEAADGSELFGGRHKEHVAYAIAVIAQTLTLQPPRALASVFLATRFELYFRLLSGRLAPDGTWLDQTAKSSALAALGQKRLPRQLANVAATYRVMLLNTESPVVQVFRELEDHLAPFYPPDDLRDAPLFYEDLGSRIKCLRDPAAHGFYSDLGAEGLFYALLTGVIFYGSS